MSSLQYVQQLSKVIVAQITQTIGWNSIQTTPLELLTDILHKYLEEITRQTQRYTELYGRTEPNLDDVALAFNDLNINVADLEEYITNVDPVPCIINVPKFPIPKESNLNFLKPGSKEVVTRPVHIHEHLPPIQPHEETPPVEPKPSAAEPNEEHNSTNIIQTYISTNQISENSSHENNNVVFENETHGDDVGDTINVIGETTVVENHTSTTSATEDATFKKPFDPSAPNQQRTNATESAPNANANANGKPTREIVSCFMTTSGFISPAREGKLPDAKKPIIIREDPEPEEILIKQRTPSPEPVVVERKHHSNKRDREIKSEHNESAKNDAANLRHNDTAYGDDDVDGKEQVKLYEVIQTVPDPPPPPKKKTKKQLDMAHMKEQKKLKKLNQLKANRMKVGAAAAAAADGNVSHSFSNAFRKGDGAPSPDFAPNVKLKKKLHKMETLKKKHKQKLLDAAATFGGADNPELTEKQHKKRMSKLSKKNLQAMGLNPYAIEGFAIPTSGDSMAGAAAAATDYEANPLQVSMKLNAQPKDNLNKKSLKQMHKLSAVPDKQKIKFFKKISTACKTNESRDHEMDRMMATDVSNLSAGAADLNHQMPQAHGFNAGDSFDGGGGNQFGAGISGMIDLNRLPANIEDLPPSKKQKLLKKLTKPPKEPKPPKIKKLKKDGMPRKERTPKAAKLLAESVAAAAAQAVAAAGLPPTQMMPDDKMMFPKMLAPPPMNLHRMPDEFTPANVGMLTVPGLNPLNPLFQSVRFDLPVRDPMQNYPFVPGPMHNFDFANLSRFKRPNFNEPIPGDGEPAMAKHSRDLANAPSKPLCNVAPLMPPSLLNMEMHRKDDYMPDASHHHEPHSSSQKHYPEPNSGYGSKKMGAQYSDQAPYCAGGGGGNDSPIVINSDDDDDDGGGNLPSQSPPPETDQSFGEVKRKKVKDKKDKEKKEKKDKETGIVKLKKKKDKKDKSKNKGEHSKTPKDKSALKKEKREKKKERERSAAALSMDTNDSMAATSNQFYSSQNETRAVDLVVTSKSKKRQRSSSRDSQYSGRETELKRSGDGNATAFNTDNSNMETSGIPKLTLKLAPSSSSPSSRTSRPSTPDFPITKKGSKKKKKQWRALEDESERSDADETAGGKLDESRDEHSAREPSPEMARISALITRPPKQKSSKQHQSTDFSSPIRNEYYDASSSSVRGDYHSAMASSTPLPATPSGRGRPKGSSSLKSSKKAAKSNVSFSAEAATAAADNQSALLDSQLHTIDEQTSEENQVWICPACGRVDDGTPMIGCDGCDDWYHWVCVGILVPPKEDQDWFCRMCISRKQEDKKKKRKKKDKKDH